MLFLLSIFKGNHFWISLRYAILSLSGFLVSIIFARLGDKEIYGLYQYVLSLVSLIAVFSIPGISLSALRSVAHGKTGAVSRAVQTSILFSLIGSAVLIAIAFFQFSKEITILGTSFLLVAFLFPFFYGFTPWYTFYEGKKDFRSVAFRSIFLSISWLVLLPVLLLLKASLPILIFSYFFLSSLFLAFFFLEGKKKHSSEGKESLSLRYAFIVTSQKFILNMSENLPVLLVGFFFGYSTIALFQVSYFPLSALSAYFGALIAMKLPDFFLGNEQEERSACTVFLQNFFSGIFASFLVIFFLTFLFQILYGKNYSDSLTMAWVLFPIVLFFPLKTYLLNYFTAKDKNFSIVKVLVFANIISTLLFIMLAKEGFSYLLAIPFYIYTLNILIVLPLFFLYLKKNSIDRCEKTQESVY